MKCALVNRPTNSGNNVKVNNIQLELDCRGSHEWSRDGCGDHNRLACENIEIVNLYSANAHYIFYCAEASTKFVSQ
jgi:hypothetical protein